MRSRMRLNFQLSPDLGELTEDEVARLGGIAQHPDWPLFIKYLHIERWATMNNAFIMAKTEAEFGFCQGDTSRINKIESDMLRYSTIAEAKTQVERAEKDHNDVTNSTFATYADDADLPLAP